MDNKKFEEDNKELIEQTAKEFNNYLNAEFYIATTLEGNQKYQRHKHLFN